MAITFTITAAGGNKIPQSDIAADKSVTLSISRLIDTIQNFDSTNQTTIAADYRFNWYFIDKPSTNTSIDTTVTTDNETVIVNSIDTWGSYRIFVIAERKINGTKSEENPLKAPEENFVTLSVESTNNKLEIPANFERNWKEKYDKLISIVDNSTKRINVLKVDNSPSGVSFTLPLTDGVSGQMLTTNGSGQLQFVDLDLSNMENNIALDTLTDVNAAAPTDGQVLKWDNATSQWIPGASTAIDGLTSDSGAQTLTIANHYDILATASNSTIGSVAIPFADVKTNAINGANITAGKFLRELEGGADHFVYFTAANTPATKTLAITDISGLRAELDSKLVSESNDLTASVTWANVPPEYITADSVTQHQSALLISTSQISDFDASIPSANQIISGNTKIEISDTGEDATVTGNKGSISLVLDGQEKWSISRGTGGTDQNYLLGTNSVTTDIDDVPALSSTSLPAGIGVRRTGNTSNGALIEFVDNSSDTEIRFKTNDREWTLTDVGHLIPTASLSGIYSSQSLGSPTNIIGSTYTNNLYVKSSLSIGTTPNSYSFPASKGTNNQILRLNSSGALVFSSDIVANEISANNLLSVTSNVVITADTASEVCFKLNAATGQTANVMQISSVESQGSATDYFVIDSTGQVSISGLSYPTSDGASGQVLVTDGSGTLYWAAQSGGGGGGATDNISEGQAKVETVDTGTDARIEFWVDPDDDGTASKVWEFDKDGHLIPQLNATYDIGSAEKKVRHFYLSNNSMFIGDNAKLSIKASDYPTSPEMQIVPGYIDEITNEFLEYDPVDHPAKTIISLDTSSLTPLTSYNLSYDDMGPSPGFSLVEATGGGLAGLSSDSSSTITLSDGYNIEFGGTTSNIGGEDSRLNYLYSNVVNSSEVIANTIFTSSNNYGETSINLSGRGSNNVIGNLNFDSQKNIQFFIDTSNIVKDNPQNTIISDTNVYDELGFYIYSGDVSNTIDDSPPSTTLKQRFAVKVTGKDANDLSVRINDSYTLPAADGLAGQALVTDGSGNLSFAGEVFSPAYVSVTMTHTSTLANNDRGSLDTPDALVGIFNPFNEYSASSTANFVSNVVSRNIEFYSSTGKFVVATDGIYEITAICVVEQNVYDVQIDTLKIVKNTSTVVGVPGGTDYSSIGVDVSTNLVVNAHSSTSPAERTISVITSLSQNDSIELVGRAGGTSGNTLTFSSGTTINIKRIA